jgi:hypothetical protein
MKKMISFALVALLALPAMAFAQTMYVQADVPGGAGQAALDVGFGATFDLIVYLDAGGESSAAEFVMTELLLIAPGVFKLNTTKINNTQLDLGDNALGEYLMAFGSCVTPFPVEMVRVNYGGFQGIPATDTVITLRGFQPGDTQPSSFAGELGFIDCNDNAIVAQLGGTDGGRTGSGVVFPDGTCVLNPTPEVVDNEAGTVGQLKARF